MNSFVEHHADLIRFAYSCFDRILFNVFIPAWQCAAIPVHVKVCRWFGRYRL